MAQRARRKRANLRDVAQAANVSVATVSRVLNRPQSVSEETRLRVQRVIETLHFVPSAAARAINSGRTRVVGALVPTLDNAIFTRFLAALEKQLALDGLSLVVATTDHDPRIEAVKARGLVDIGAEALIVSGITHSAEFDRLVARTRLPVVATSYYDEGYRLPTVGYDNADASRRALDFLVSQGHRQIAVIHGPTAHNDRTRARLAGLEVDTPGLSLHPFETEISVQGGCSAMGRLLADGAACSAIICFSDVLAMGALFELQRHGMSVPEAMSLVGIDDLPLSSCTSPEITTVRLPVARMGEATATAVVQWLDHQIVPTPTLLPVELIVRNSTRPIS